MRLRHRIATALALLLVLLTLPGAAFANGDAAARDCANDGRLDKTYTQAELADALAHLPADVDEYSDCRDVLRRALLNQAGNSGQHGGGGGGTAGGTGGTGSSSGSGGAPLTPSTDADRQALNQAATSGGQPVQIAGRNVTPGEGDVRNSLPATLIVVLALLAAAAVAAMAPYVRRQAQHPLTALRRVLPGRSG
jgi:hypothetical protein